MIGRSASGVPPQHGARRGGVHTIRLVLDLDGLLQRFGRTVPEAVALLVRARELQVGQVPGSSGRALEVYVGRFAPSERGELRRAELMRDLEQLGLAAHVAALGAEPLLFSDATELAAWGGAGGIGVMLMSGRRRPVAQALATGVPAYLVSDQRLRGPEQLAIVEAERVVAESLHFPTPRPMSDETRTGMLLSFAVASLAEARARIAEAVLSDPRADWVVMDRVLLYTESPDVERSLIVRAKAERLRAGISKSALAVSPPGVTPAGEFLFAADGYALVVGGPAEAGGAAIAWANARRRVFVPPGAPAMQPHFEPTDGPSNTAGRFEEALAHNQHDIAPEELFATLRAILPPIAAPDLASPVPGLSFATFASPHGTGDAEGLIAVTYGARAAPAGEPRTLVAAGDVDMALAIAAALARRRRSAGVLHYLSPMAPPLDVVDQLLWQGERNRIVAVIRLDRHPPAALGRDFAVTASPSLLERLHPVFGSTLAADPSGEREPVLTLSAPSAVRPDSEVVDLVDAAIAALVP